MIIALLVWLLATNCILIDPILPTWLIIAAYRAQIAGWLIIIGYNWLRGTKPAFLLLPWLFVGLLSIPFDMQTAAEIIRLFGFVSLFGLGITNTQVLRRTADTLWPVVLLWGAVSNANPNDISMALWLVTILSNNRWWYAPTAAIIMLVAGSEGALIALVVALAVERFGWRAMIPAPVAMLGLAILRGPGSSAGVRVTMWRSALGQFSPWGNGLPFRWAIGDQVFGYAHNLPVSVAFVAGVPGLLVLGLSCWWLWQNRNLMGDWAGFIAGFAVYSLMDYPHWGVPGAVAMLIIGGIYKNGNTLGRRFNVFGITGINYRIGVCRRPGLVAKPDPHRAA